VARNYLLVEHEEGRRILDDHFVSLFILNCLFYNILKYIYLNLTKLYNEW
jgi:hypothetical protein